jgi:hypothetical protein
VTFTGPVNLGTSTVAINGNLALSSAQLSTTLAGSASTQFGHFQRSGSASLTSSTLHVSVQAPFAPTTGAAFAVLGQNSTGALTGTFTGLAEHGGFVANGINFGITYSGGSGNDAVIQVVGPATQLAFGTVPTGGTAGLALSPSVTVKVEDANHFVVAGDTSTITMAIAAGPGTLGGVFKVKAVGGVATFNDLVLSLAGTYSLKASDGTLASATTGSFKVG